MSEVSHAIDLKAEMTSRRQILTAKQWKTLKTNFNCKAVEDIEDDFSMTSMTSVEVAEVIEKVRLRRNKIMLDEVKKHRRTEKQFKELNEKLRSTLPEQQIN